jgi:hypothetical protein
MSLIYDRTTEDTQKTSFTVVGLAWTDSLLQTGTTDPLGRRGRISGEIGTGVCVSAVGLSVCNNSDVCPILFSPRFTKPRMRPNTLSATWLQCVVASRRDVVSRGLDAREAGGQAS